MTEDNAAENARLELEKARQALAAARHLIAGGFWDDAVSRAYYVAFHAATAALYRAGVQARTHAGVHDLLFEHYVRPGRISRAQSKALAALQRYREEADYGTGPRYDEPSATEEVERAERFLAAIDEVLS